MTYLARTAPTSTPVSRPSRPFSAEIHGVRGLALSMVVAFHLFGAGRVSGGVDVFLVISAYLMTGSLLRSLEAGHLSIVYRYGRTFSRLLPAALSVIVATMGIGTIVLPRSQWLELFAQGKAAALFRENIYLGTTGLSYGAAGHGASPFQHFWSLSMQGQFLLLWPIVVAGLLLLPRVGSRRKILLFAAFIVLVSVASFLFAIRLVSVDQALAYYSLRARLWEFGLGSLVVFVVPWAKGRPWLWGPLGWLGVGLILSSGFVVDGANSFPGPWALWPVGGALLVLLSAESGGAARCGLTVALAAKPIAWLANLGYPLYLWHWPLLVYYLVWRDQVQIGFLAALGLMVGSLLLSGLTRRWISMPFVKWANRKQRSSAGGLILAVTVLGLALAVAGLAQVGVSREEHFVDRQLAAADDAGRDAWLLAGDGGDDQLPASDPEGPWVPSPEVAERDIPSIYEHGCVQDWNDGPGLDEVLVCPDFPGPESSAQRPTSNAAKRVVLSGGSHVVMYYPAFRELADEEGWELLVVDKDGCRLAADGPDSTRNEACQQWNRSALPTIIGLQPDAVVTLGTITSSKPEKEETYTAEQLEVWQALSDEGIAVVALRDTPRAVVPVPECLQKERNMAECGINRGESLADTFPLSTETALPERVVPIDLTSRLCQGEVCPAVIGNIVVYRDADHLTATYAQTLTPALREELRQSAPWLVG